MVAEVGLLLDDSSDQPVGPNGDQKNISRGWC